MKETFECSLKKYKHSTHDLSVANFNSSLPSAMLNSNPHFELNTYSHSTLPEAFDKRIKMDIEQDNYMNLDDAETSFKGFDQYFQGLNDQNDKKYMNDVNKNEENNEEIDEGNDNMNGGNDAFDNKLHYHHYGDNSNHNNQNIVDEKYHNCEEGNDHSHDGNSNDYSGNEISDYDNTHRDDADNGDYHHQNENNHSHGNDNYAYNDNNDDNDDNNGGNNHDDNDDNNDDSDIIFDVYSNESYYPELNSDLLNKIFLYLECNDLSRASMVCKLWKEISDKETFWTKLNFKSPQITLSCFSRYCQKYPNAVHVDITSMRLVDEHTVTEALTYLPNLHTLILGNGTVLGNFFSALEQIQSHCRKLKLLHIHGSMVRDVMHNALDIDLIHSYLTEVEIVSCLVMNVNIQCPLLEKLSLKKSSVISVDLTCPMVTHLDLSCTKLSDSSLRVVISSCPNLTSLLISECFSICDETFRIIRSICSNLTHLDSSFCHNLSFEGIRFQSMVDFNLYGCDGICMSSIESISHSLSLRTLVLDYCSSLNTVNLNLPNLESLSMENCKILVEVSLSCKSLFFLNVKRCCMLSRLHLESNEMRMLDVRGEISLKFISLRCPNLLILNLSDCLSLNDAALSGICGGSDCSNLQQLILDNCLGLLDLTLSSSSLTFLSMNGCTNLHALTLSAPLLTNMHLDGCSKLSEVQFNDIRIPSLDLSICPHLTSICIRSSFLTSLILQGCGLLRTISLSCFNLFSFDASYCSQLEDEGLSLLPLHSPHIHSLIIPSCVNISPKGLSSLSLLSFLSVLDLSYTFLTNLTVVFSSCKRLTILRLSACKFLNDDALAPLHHGHALPLLTELDISYGRLSRDAISNLLLLCPHLSRLSLSGCINAKDCIWDSINSPLPPSFSRQEFISSSSHNASSVNVGMILSESASMNPSRNFPNSYPVTKVNTDGQSQEIFHADSKNSDETMDVHNHERMNSYDLNRATPCQSACLFDSMDMSTLSSLSSPASTFNANDANDSLIAYSSKRMLHTLNCVGCQGIQNVFIHPSPSSYTLLLSVLNLSLSNNVKVVNLNCPNLTSLNLSNCISLTALELTCPKLSNLCLQGCNINKDIIENVIKKCNYLGTLDIRFCPKIKEDDIMHFRNTCPSILRLYNNFSR